MVKDGPELQQRLDVLQGLFQYDGPPVSRRAGITDLELS